MKTALGRKSPKTVNNVLTVLNVLLKTAVEWAVIERLPCMIRLVRTSVPTASFHESADYARLVQFAQMDGRLAHLVVLLGGGAGLRCGEMMALEWGDINLAQRQLVVARSDWKGQVTTPKSGRLRRLPLTMRLAEALAGARHLKGTRVLVSPAGQPLTQKVVQGLVRGVARRAKVKEGVHTLRHTFCSELAARGVRRGRFRRWPDTRISVLRSGTCTAAPWRSTKLSGCWNASGRRESWRNAGGGGKTDLISSVSWEKWWRRRESNPRPKGLSPQKSTCVAVLANSRAPTKNGECGAH